MNNYIKRKLISVTNRPSVVVYSCQEGENHQKYTFDSSFTAFTV